MQEELLNQITQARATAGGRSTNARQRIGHLLDPGSFEEYGPLAGRTTKTDDPINADGMLGGGRQSRRRTGRRGVL